MTELIAKTQLPPIPAKRYFTIGEVSDLCGVKPHVLRYWEQEFTQLKPVKRRGNRRYYQHHEVLLIRKIRDLLYEQGFTISGARNRLDGAEEKAEVVEMPQEQTTSQVVRLKPESTNVVNFVDLRKKLSEVIQLLRA
jgi:DNA-binding transcriptional MerR regulator